jgi:hypothetical protein
MKCERCGEVNPAEIHTCTPNYVDRRQWRYDPMTGEPITKGNYFDLLDEHEAKLKAKNYDS